MLHTTYVTPKREFSRYIQRMKHQKENFHATYNVCNTKKKIFTLHTTYVTPKREFSRYIQRMKHQKEDFHATYNV